MNGIRTFELVVDMVLLQLDCDFSLISELLSRRMPGLDPTTVREHVIRAERVAAVIWRRWQVGPWQVDPPPRLRTHG
jgi:hypothetical protein